jgi:hypothetical protein
MGGAHLMLEHLFDPARVNAVIEAADAPDGPNTR